MASSLIRGRYVIVRAGGDAQSSTVVTDGAVYQRDGVIEDVGPYTEVRSRRQADEEIGGPGYLVFPGLVNSHHHGRGLSTLQLGTTDDCLETWILSGWGRRPVDDYLMTLYTTMQQIESGTTTVMYNHSTTPATGLEDNVNKVLDGFRDVGMRSAFSVMYRGQNRVVYDDDDKFISSLPTELGDALRTHVARNTISVDDYFSLFEKLHKDHGADPAGRTRVLLSPANVQWADDGFLERTKEYATRYNTGVHIHLVETMYQKAYGLRRWGSTPATHLGDLGFLGPELSCAHAIWLTEDDIDLLAGAGATVCHNASSNLRLKNGVAPVGAMVGRGLNVALGTDSTAINDDDDMIQEMRLVAKLHREPGLDAPAITSHQVLRNATINAAKPTFFHDDIGALEVGRRADAVLLDMASINGPYMDPDVDPIDALLYRGKAQDVKTVVIDGEVVMRDGRFTRVNKDDVVAQLREQLASPVEPQVLRTRSMAADLIPHVQRFYDDWSTDQGAPHYRFNARS
jgi:cytosine/adenosine deaminase-related metal-dependent hydrolase